MIPTNSQQVILPTTYTMKDDYDKNSRPNNELTDVTIGLYLNRISAVDENKEEITFDAFLQVIWEDKRIQHKNDSQMKDFIELKMEERQKIWVPDLYIRQLQEMKILSVFEEISSLRLYKNSTLIFSLGATIIIKCDMDFVLYPLDVQKCHVDFSSYKYSVKDMIFRWKRDNPITFPKDFGAEFFRLPRYVVSFYTEQTPHILSYGDADHFSARLEITLSREIKSYLLENYLPSTLFVSMSWGSFVVVPEIVPGRMVLLVTTLLSLVTMFDTVRNNSPDALELKCIEVWLISCTLFVFLALIEYFIVLFGIRYDKHWRTVKNKISMPTPTTTTSTVTTTTTASASILQQNPVTTSKIIQSNSETTPMTTIVQHQQSPHPQQSQLIQRKNGLEHTTARVFSNLHKIQPESKGKLTTTTTTTQIQEVQQLPPHVQQTISRNNSNTLPQQTLPTTINSPNPNLIHRKRFRNVAEYALLYAGSQRGKLDQISLVLFPLSFIIFSIIYWVLYLSEARKKM